MYEKKTLNLIQTVKKADYILFHLISFSSRSILEANARRFWAKSSWTTKIPFQLLLWMMRDDEGL